MPTQPQVGKSYEVAAGNRAEVLYKLPKPDVQGVLFIGTVKLNGSIDSAGWNNGGVCPANHDYNLDSLWPADDSRQYQPVIKTPEGVYRAMAAYYAEIGSLKHDWIPKGAEYALKLERDNQGAPTAEIINLEQV